MFVGQAIIAHKKDCLPRCVLDTQIPCRCRPLILLADKFNVVWIIFLWDFIAPIVDNHEFPLVSCEGLFFILFQTPQKQASSVERGHDHREFYHGDSPHTSISINKFWRNADSVNNSHLWNCVPKFNLVKCGVTKDKIKNTGLI